MGDGQVNFISLVVYISKSDMSKNLFRIEFKCLLEILGGSVMVICVVKTVTHLNQGRLVSLIDL